MSQGKAFDKDKVMESLEPYFKLGYSRNKACICAGFKPETLQKWVDKDPELLIKIQSWQNLVSAKARSNIVIKINQGDPEYSWKWLERKESKEFGRDDKLRIDGEFTIKDFYKAVIGPEADQQSETPETAELPPAPSSTGGSGKHSQI